MNRLDACAAAGLMVVGFCASIIAALVAVLCRRYKVVAR